MKTTLYMEAVKTLGPVNQLRQTQEEAGELISAIGRFLRGRTDASVLAEEIADMEIMTAQARLIVGDAAVDKHKGYKLERLGNLVLKASEEATNGRLRIR